MSKCSVKFPKEVIFRLSNPQDIPETPLPLWGKTFRGSTVGFLSLQHLSKGLGVEYSSCFILVLNLALYVCCFDPWMSRNPSCGPNILHVYEPQQDLGRGLWPCKTGLSPPCASAVVYSNCLCSSAFCLSLTF